jgi:hypothetical protein
MEWSPEISSSQLIFGQGQSPFNEKGKIVSTNFAGTIGYPCRKKILPQLLSYLIQELS